MFTATRTYLPALYLTGAAACWGIATVISKRAVEEIHPLTLLPIQLAVSVTALTVLMYAQRIRVTWSAGLWRLGALGVLNPGVSYALSLLGLAHITASMSVLLWTVEPLLILVLARWVLHDKLSPAVAITSTVAFAGVILVVFYPGTGGNTLGVTLTLAGATVCAAYTVACRKMLADDSTLTVVMIQQCCALGFAIALLTATHLGGSLPTLHQVSAWGWLSATLSGLLYYAAAFWLYLSGLQHVPAATAAIFINLIPVFGVAAGYLLLAERLTAQQWLGAGIVVTAVASVALLSRSASNA